MPQSDSSGREQTTDVVVNYWEISKAKCFLNSTRVVSNQQQHKKYSDNE